MRGPAVARRRIEVRASGGDCPQNRPLVAHRFWGRLVLLITGEIQAEPQAWAVAGLGWADGRRTLGTVGVGPGECPRSESNCVDTLPTDGRRESGGYGVGEVRGSGGLAQKVEEALGLPA